MMQYNSTEENKLCKGDCGFFGAPEFNGFCSKCFTEDQPQLKQPERRTDSKLVKKKERVDGIVLILHKLVK